MTDQVKREFYFDINSHQMYCSLLQGGFVDISNVGQKTYQIGPQNIHSFKNLNQRRKINLSRIATLLII